MKNKVYEHQDSMGQDLKLNSPIAFTSAYVRGVKVGTVVKLTRLRVKIKYNYTYKSRDGEIKKGFWHTLIAPDRTIQLGEELPQSLTYHILKNS